MEIKKIKIGRYETENNVFLAPMAGYTDFAFRSICKDYGAGLTFTELVSAKGLHYGSNKGNERLLYKQEKGLSSAQIFGSEKDIMAKAVNSPFLEEYPIIDINMGCPVPKVYKNGDGSALLNDIHKAEEIVSACAKQGKPITVKMRIGLTEGNYTTRDYAVMCEQSGASLITIHGRVREAYYSGEVNFDEIRKAKQAVGIPVIANGGIFTPSDADKMMAETGADGVMIARGAVDMPYIFSEILGKEYSFNAKETFIKHAKMLLTRFDDRYVTVNMRKFITRYFKGGIMTKEMKMRLYSAETTQEMLKILEEYE